MNAAAKVMDLGNQNCNASLPITPCQVYGLGVEVNHLVATMYQLLAESCNEPKINVVNDYIDYNRREAKILKEKLNHLHNYELSRFYESGGLETYGAEAPVNLAILKGDFKWFFYKLDQHLEISANVNMYNVTLTAREMNKIYKEIVKDISNFYQLVSAFYLDGEMKKAFLDLYRLVKQTSYSISNTFTLNAVGKTDLNLRLYSKDAVQTGNFNQK